jgi:hypothetical protein
MEEGRSMKEKEHGSIVDCKRRIREPVRGGRKIEYSEAIPKN